MNRLEITLSEALPFVGGDIYLLSIVVAKRAEQIANGDEPLVSEDEIKDYKPADIALLELSKGLLEYDVA
jgi:DNA-directed RNA polymerase subunit omega